MVSCGGRTVRSIPEFYMTIIVAINGKNDECVAGSGHSNVLSTSFGFLWNLQFNLHLLTEMMTDKNVHCRTKPDFVLHHSQPGLGALAKVMLRA
jgi:hypothetical protein